MTPRRGQGSVSREATWAPRALSAPPGATPTWSQRTGPSRAPRMAAKVRQVAAPRRLRAGESGPGEPEVEGGGLQRGHVKQHTITTALGHGNGVHQRLSTFGNMVCPRGDMD